MNETDLKIFELIKLLQGLRMIKYQSDFGNAIGILKQNLTRVKQGEAHFKTEHIKNICEVYNVNANWIFGIENNVFNVSKRAKNKVKQE